MSGAPERPTGAPLAVEIDGILEGRVADTAALTAAAAALDLCGRGRFACDVNGGRFSLLPVATELRAAPFDESAQARFLDGLQAIAAAATAGSLESTLRCRLVYADAVAETLFVARGAALEPVTRLRARAGTGEPHAAAAPAALPFGLGRRELLLIAPLLLLAGLFGAWQSGLIDRMLAARAEGMAVQLGPFQELLDARLERSWGNYRVEVRRGPGYPPDPAALSARRDAAKSLPERAACEAAGNGGEAWLQLRNAEGKVLVAVRIELRDLLLRSDAVVKATLPGRIDAAAIAVSLTRDEPQGR